MRDEIPAWERREARNAKVKEELKLKRARLVKPKRPRSPLQYVYFVRSQEFVKIGWVTSIETRMNNFQVGNPHIVEMLAMMVGGQREESLLHAHFWNDHHRGEWFRLSDRLQSLITEIAGLEPLDARIMAGGWFIKNAGMRQMLLSEHDIRRLRKREEDTANAVGSVPVVLPEAEKVL